MKKSISDNVKLKNGYRIDEYLINSLVNIFSAHDPEVKIDISVNCGTIEYSFSSADEFYSEVNSFTEMIDRIQMKADFGYNKENYYRNLILLDFWNDRNPFFDRNIVYTLDNASFYHSIKAEIDSLFENYKSEYFSFVRWHGLDIYFFVLSICLFIFIYSILNRFIIISQSTLLLSGIFFGYLVLILFLIFSKKVKNKLFPLFEFWFGVNKFYNRKIGKKRTLHISTVFVGLIVSILGSIIVNCIF